MHASSPTVCSRILAFWVHQESDRPCLTVYAVQLDSQLYSMYVCGVVLVLLRSMVVLWRSALAVEWLCWHSALLHVVTYTSLCSLCSSQLPVYKHLVTVHLSSSNEAAIANM